METDTKPSFENIRPIIPFVPVMAFGMLFAFFLIYALILA